MTTTGDGTNYCDNLASNLVQDAFDTPINNVSIQDFSTRHLYKTHIETLESNDPSSRLLTNSAQNTDRKKEVFKFETDWLISSVSWSNNGTYRLALASYLEQYENFIQIVNLNRDECEQDINSVCTFEHPYPATKVLWSPKQTSNSSQLVATTADYLRLWRLDEGESATQTNKRVQLECLLNGNQNPLTSFDWSSDASLIVTSSFDTACTIWDVNVGKIISLFNSAHANPNGNSVLEAQDDHHLYDVAWAHRSTGRDEIVLCEDSSIKLYDLRGPTNLTTTLYEMNNQIISTGKTALVRVGCSRQDTNLVAAFADNSGQLIVLDLRKTGRPVCVLNHADSINSISWSPKSSKGICSGNDDNQALIWQVSDQSNPINEPLLTYRADGKINTVSWAPSNVFIAIGYRNVLELLRV